MAIKKHWQFELIFQKSAIGNNKSRKKAMSSRVRHEKNIFLNNKQRKQLVVQKDDKKTWHCQDKKRGEEK